MTRLGFYYVTYNNKYKLVKTIDVPWDFDIEGPDSDKPTVDTPIIGEWEPMKYVLQKNNIAYEDDNQIIVKEKIKLAPSQQKNIIKLYRITYNHEGIFEAVRKYMTPEEWSDFLNNENVNWLYKPDEYKNSYISYFTEAGYEQFKEKTFPLILNIFQKENIKTSVLEVIKENEEFNIKEEEDSSGQQPNPPTFEDWITQYFYNILFNEKSFFDVFNNGSLYLILAEENMNVGGFMIVHKGRTIINFEEHDYRNIINACYPNIRKDMIIIDDSFGGYDEDKEFSQNKIEKDDSFGGHDEDKDFLI